MHEQKLFHPTYTMQHSGHHGFGMPMHQPHPSMHGFCHSCCHPIMNCCCGIRECRKEAKELLVNPKSKIKEKKADASDTPKLANSAHFNLIQALDTKIELLTQGQEETFIGGGCCVHLSIEYMPNFSASTNSGFVRVKVVDSEETVLQWIKIVKPGSAYQIKEAIISTNPGAMLQVTVNNVTARVRWCECFSC